MKLTPSLSSALALAAALVGTLAPRAAAQTFSSAGGITIPISGAASPYPSTIAVSGMAAPTSLRVQLTSFTHTFPSDIGVLLVAPSGQASVIMFGEGGDDDANGVTFQIAADTDANNFPHEPGTYGPSNIITTSFFPAPAPAGPYVPMINLLASNPNGNWRLYVMDGSGGDSGQIGSWSIIFNAPPAPAGLKPFQFTYQGRLTNSSGAPITTPVDLRFSLWNHPTSTILSNRLNAETEVSGVTPAPDGTFTVPVEFSSLGNVNAALYVQVAVENPPGSPSVILTPRQPLTSSPVSSFAWNARSSRYARDAEQAAAADYADKVGGFEWVSSRLQHVETPPDASLAGGGALVLGSTAEANIVMDNNEILARDNGATSTLFLNTNGGSVNVNTGAVNANAQLNVGNQFLLLASGAAIKPGGGTWAASSDPRFKHDIHALTGTLDKLLTLRGYTFKYNDDHIASGIGLPGTQIGLMADEVERVFPDWVSYDDKGFRYVTERSTTALMVEALRDLRAEKDAELARVRADMKAESDALKARLAELEKLVRETAPTKN